MVVVLFDYNIYDKLEEDEMMLHLLKDWHRYK